MMIRQAEGPRHEAEDAEWASKLIGTLEAFRTLHTDITASQIITILQVGMNPGVTQRRIGQLTGVRDGTVSRILAVVSDRGLRGRPGLGVVSIEPAPDNHRERNQYLTPKGRALWTNLRRIMRK